MQDIGRIYFSDYRYCKRYVFPSALEFLSSSWNESCQYLPSGTEELKVPSGKGVRICGETWSWIPRRWRRREVGCSQSSILRHITFKCETKVPMTFWPGKETLFMIQTQVTIYFKASSTALSCWSPIGPTASWILTSSYSSSYFCGWYFCFLSRSFPSIYKHGITLIKKKKAYPKRYTLQLLSEDSFTVISLPFPSYPQGPSSTQCAWC